MPTAWSRRSSTTMAVSTPALIGHRVRQPRAVRRVGGRCRAPGWWTGIGACLPAQGEGRAALPAGTARTRWRPAKADQPAPERFAGILAPSISHEGYPSPTHSYWDDYWGLKGWHDGAWLAESLGDPRPQWAREQYKLLYDAARLDPGDDGVEGHRLHSLRPTWAMAIPPAYRSLTPPGRRALPAEALRTTFARYLDDVRKRSQPGALYAYTPYDPQRAELCAPGPAAGGR